MNWSNVNNINWPGRQDTKGDDGRIFVGSNKQTNILSQHSEVKCQQPKVHCKHLKTQTKSCLYLASGSSFVRKHATDLLNAIFL